MLNIFRRRKPAVEAQQEQARCTCARCNCPHELDVHEKRTNSLGYEQVYCRACNDICLTHSL
jgi:hypothetical protein